MSTPGFVLGVLGLCWVGSGNPTQAQALYGAGCGVLCWVCWVCARAQACTHSYPTGSPSEAGGVLFLHARNETINTPNTPNTVSLKALILLGFLCVGCVLGLAVLCWVGSCEGEAGHD
jgi:drug/metabolite transporter (DMT)-like permease